jgi:uncharacterized protein (DUF302 family)
MSLQNKNLKNSTLSKSQACCCTWLLHFYSTFNGRKEKMSYYFSKIMPSSFDEAIEKTKEELKKEGFGVLTEIDVKETLKKKLNVDFSKYKILGACNPNYAYKALQAENKIGTMLPCNVIIQQVSPSQVEVAAIDPVASMQAVENPELEEIASKVREKLQSVISRL